MKINSSLKLEYDPLSVAFSLVAKGGGYHQLHSADKNTFMPDRSVTPLAIMPTVSFKDPHSIITSLPLSSFVWKENDVVISSNDRYTVSTTGAEKGKLLVKANVAHGKTIVLSYEGEYLDTRSNKVIKLGDTVVLTCTSQAEYPLKLEVNTGDNLVHDPILNGNANVSVEPQLYLADAKLTTAKAQYWFYLQQPDDSWLLITDALKTSLIVSVSDTAIVVKPNAFDGQKIKIVADYKVDGNALASPSPRAKSSIVSFTRMYSQYSASINSLGGRRVAVSTAEKKMEVVILDKNGVRISNPETIFNITWKAKSGAAGSSWVNIGSGSSLTITKAKLIEYGLADTLNIEADIQEVTADKALATQANMLTDNNNVITSR